MTSKFKSNVGSVRTAKIARSDVVDINAYRKVKKSDIFSSIIILSEMSSIKLLTVIRCYCSYIHQTVILSSSVGRASDC